MQDDLRIRSTVEIILIIGMKFQWGKGWWSETVVDFGSRKKQTYLCFFTHKDQEAMRDVAELLPFQVCQSSPRRQCFSIIALYFLPSKGYPFAKNIIILFEAIEVMWLLYTVQWSFQVLFP